MAATTLSSETLQSIVLAALSAGPITDTRELALAVPGVAPPASGAPVVGPEPEEQLALKGALDSLQLREVSQPTCRPFSRSQAPALARSEATADDAVVACR